MRGRRLRRCGDKSDRRRDRGQGRRAAPVSAATVKPGGALSDT
jgi:hypothetical protein